MENENVHEGEEQQLIVFTLADEEFGFNINDVREIIKMVDITVVPDIDENFKGIINLRGGIVAVMDLSKKLGFRIKEPDKDTRIIVTEVGDNMVGLMVDNVKEVLRISNEVIKDAPQVIESKVHEDYLKGVAVLGERLIILLDSNNIIGEEGIKQIQKIQKENPSAKEKPKEEKK